MAFKEQRLKAGLSAEATAVKLGVTRQSVYGWEKGLYLPSANILRRLADVYGCTMEELLEGEDRSNDESV